MSNFLFTPINLGFIVVNPGIHGTTTRITYTVPLGHRAEVRSGVMQFGYVAGFAINISNLTMQINGANKILMVNRDFANMHTIEIGSIDLVTGDTILMLTIQNAVGAISYAGSLFIREYQ